MLNDIRVIANEYTISIFLNISFITHFFKDFDICKASKYFKITNILLFISLCFF